MRSCNCVLAMRGYCCQDGPPIPTVASNRTFPSIPPWWQQPGSGTTVGAGQMYTYGSKAKVRKSRWQLGWADTATPWVVTNHPAGTMSFRTWEEAMMYANSRPRMMNVEVHDHAVGMA